MIGAQDFKVTIIQVQTKETWEMWVRADDPPDAIGKTCRRKHVQALLASETPVRFEVGDAFRSGPR